MTLVHNLIYDFSKALAQCDTASVVKLAKEEILLEGGAIFKIDLNDPLGPALKTAVSNKAWPHFLKTLIDLGANINGKDLHGGAPLHEAVSIKSPDIETITLLLELGAKIDPLDKYGNSPLGFAASAGNIEVVKFLLEKGADINSQNHTGYTAAMAALYWAGNNSSPPKSFATARFLIEHPDTDLTISMKDGETLLDIARKKSDTPSDLLALIEQRILDKKREQEAEQALKNHARNIEKLDKILKKHKPR